MTFLLRLVVSVALRSNTSMSCPLPCNKILLSCAFSMKTSLDTASLDMEPPFKRSSHAGEEPQKSGCNSVTAASCHAPSVHMHIGSGIGGQLSDSYDDRKPRTFRRSSHVVEEPQKSGCNSVTAVSCHAPSVHMHIGSGIGGQLSDSHDRKPRKVSESELLEFLFKPSSFDPSLAPDSSSICSSISARHLNNAS